MQVQRSFKLLAALLMGMTGAGAFAATTWAQGSGTCTQAAINAGGVGNSCAISGADANVTVSAWANTNGGTVANGYNGKYETATLKAWDGSGFAVQNRNPGSIDDIEGSSPEHAVDNDDFTDGLMFSFSKSVTLNSLTIGWSCDKTCASSGDSNTARDADVSVLAYTGTGNPFAALDPNYIQNQTVSQLLSKGWTLVGNYANVDDLNPTGPGGTKNFSTAVSSSWWLVTAYNSAFGTGTNLEGGNDFFKLLSVSGTSSSGGSGAPEPAGLALVALAAFGAAVARRRKHA